MKYGKILVTVLAVAANSFAWTYEPRGAKFSADGSKLVFLSSSGPEGYDIYTANADGSGKVKLDLPAGLWGEPYLSPDGKKVAFVTDDEFLNGNVFAADVDGNNLRQLTKYGDDPSEKRDPFEKRVGVLGDGLTFSPDGRKILFSSDEFGSQDIFSVNVDGTGKTRLTDFAEYDESGPAFMPGGNEIIFNVRGTGKKGGIWVINADGSAKKRLPVPVNAELVAVSPDGKRIAYGTIQSEAWGSYVDAFYVTALDGSNLFKVTVIIESQRDLAFSADGSKVVYAAFDVGRGRFYRAIDTVNADGTGEKNLTRQWDSIWNPAFFADGAKIVFSGSFESFSCPFPVPSIYTMDADGSNLKPFPATEGMDVQDFVVSPTGDRFLFQVRAGSFFKDSERYVSADYFVVNADGTGLTRLTEGGVRFDARHPTWRGTFSADGSKVAYLSCQRSPGGVLSWAIHTVNADGSGSVKFEVPGGVWGEPYFSPDGKKVAFTTDNEFLNGNIFVADVNGKNLRQVTKYGDDPFEKRDPFEERVGVLDDGLAFSPDGRRILYCSEESGSQDIFAVNVDGTGNTRLTDFDGWEGEPVFLPGRDKVLFEATSDWVRNEIWIMNADGSGKKKVPVPGYAELMAVSPDGKKIEYRFVTGPDCGTYVANLDGSGRFKIADFRTAALDLSFSPDGEKVLYRLDDAVFVVNADGSGRKALTPTWDYIQSVVFFADGAKIAFVGRTRPDSRNNIYTVAADGSDLKPFKATEGMDVRELIVSPTGDKFLVEGDYYGEVTDGYFVVNADGTGLVEVSPHKPPPPDETEE